MWLALWLAPAVAVLPLRDVDGDVKTGGLAAAMRQVIAADLAELRGTRVIDRAAIDRALSAAKIDARANDPDPEAIKRLARALDLGIPKVRKRRAPSVESGFVVTGAFQRGESRLKLWARFMSADGKITRTATTSGPGSDLLLMLNTVEAELLRAVGAPRQTVAGAAYRIRPRLRSLRSMELYGDSLIEPDDEKRRHLLQLALDADPTLRYAARDLESLEGRLPSRDPGAAGAIAQAVREASERLKERVRSEKDPARITEHYVLRFAELQRQRRYRTLIAEATAIVQNPPPAVPDLAEQLPETAQYLMVAAYDQLNDDDSVVREGQRFMASYALSDGFVGVRQLVDAALTRKQQRDEGRAKAAAALDKLAPGERNNPCRVAEVFDDHHQLAEARQAFERCLDTPGKHDPQVVQLIWVCYHQADFRAVSRLLEKLQKEFPGRYRQVMHLADELPVD